MKTAAAKAITKSFQEDLNGVLDVPDIYFRTTKSEEEKEKVKEKPAPRGVIVVN